MCSKRRDKYRVDGRLYLVIESKSWWWSAYISLSIFNILLVHYTTLSVTELLPIVIGLDVSVEIKVRIHYLKSVWIFVALSTLSLERMATSYLASTLASSLDSSIKFGSIGCSLASGMSGKG